MADKPVTAILRTYQVGFGDCFLLTIEYDDGEARHILLDFGSTGLPSTLPRDQMSKVAENIAEQCKNKLHIVVATHRHKDHISGFSTDNARKGKGKSTGEVIKDCNPDIVIQPWTEHPGLAANATAAPADAPENDQALQAANLSFTKSLDNMNLVSDGIRHELQHLADPAKFNKTPPQQIVDRLSFLTDDNGVKNASAVENLNNKESGMSGERHYVNYGYDLELEKILPGVKIRVLGPPNLEQYDQIKKERASDKEEFWMLYAATADMRKALIENDSEVLFPGADAYERTTPGHTRWFIRKLRGMRVEQLLQIVRILDDAMNNTSVILMFEIGKQKFLFPGDAQIENWEYALKHAKEHKDNLKLLKETTLYKVGHHGSRNATPRTLWDTFGKKTEERSPDRLKTVVSTMAGKHGNPDRQSEVPRQTLVDALESLSDYYSTEELDEKKGLFHDIEIDLR
jgi:hypothetical protein